MSQSDRQPSHAAIPALELASAGKSFPRRKALDDVTLTIHEGEMVALIGPSGAGKSTLMRATAGLITTDRVESGIWVHGQPVQRNGRIAWNIRRIRAGIGFIFQQFNLVGRLSLLTNVLTGILAQVPLHRRLVGWFTEEERLAAMEALDSVGMAEFAAQRAGTLSGGQQQRGAIARAVVQGARLILADEPIASLDPESARLVMEGLRQMNRDRKVTVVVSVHQLEFARRYCDRVIAMKDGRIECDVPTDQLDVQALEAIYGPNCADLYGGDGKPAKQTTQNPTESTNISQLDVEARAGA